MADPQADASEYVEHEEDIIAVATRTKKRVKPRDLKPRVVYNSFLEPPPTTDTGSSSQVQTADEEAHEDEPKLIVTTSWILSILYALIDMEEPLLFHTLLSKIFLIIHFIIICYYILIHKLKIIIYFAVFNLARQLIPLLLKSFNKTTNNHG
jgi:hypothetical protein